MSVNIEKIPNELKQLNQWGVWKNVPKQKKDGSTKNDKVPYNPTTHKRQLKENYHPFKTVINTINNSVNGYSYDGINFLPKQGDNITVIDVDNCFIIANGAETLTPDGQAIAHHFKDSYLEKSPSGKGLRGFVYGKPGRCGKGTKSQHKNIEVYDHSSLKTFSVTGNHIPESASNVTNQQDALDWLHETFFKPKKVTPQPKRTLHNSPILSDSEIIEKLNNAKNSSKFNALWNDNSESNERDLSLCCLIAFYTQDHSQIDSIFRQSNRIRPKWDKIHSKDGLTYGQITITKAVKSITTTYQGKSTFTPKHIPNAHIQENTVSHSIDQAGISKTTQEHSTDHIPTQNLHVISITPTEKTQKKKNFFEGNNGNYKLVAQSIARRRLIENGDITNLAYNPIVEDWYQYKNGLWSVTQPEMILKQIDSVIEKNLNTIGLGFSNNWRNGIFQMLRTPLAIEFWDNQLSSQFIPFKNGILNLKTMSLIPHSPEYLFTWQLPYNYEPKAECQPIINWLHECVLGNNSLVQLLRAYLKAVLTQKYHLERYLEIIGDGGSGKSTFSWLCSSLIGHENTRATDFKSLEGNRFELSSLYGKRLVLLTDEDKFAGNVSNFKKITGGDSLRFEDKHKSIRGEKSRDFVYQGMVIVIANQPIRSSDYTSGLARRRLTIYFKNQPITRRNLKGKEGEFFKYLPGLVNWCLSMPDAECEQILLNGDRILTSLIKTRLENLEDVHPLYPWLESNCTYSLTGFTPIGSKKRVSRTEKSESESRTFTEYENQDSHLYPNYCAWCDQNNKYAISSRDFTKFLIELCQTQLKIDGIRKDSKKIGQKTYRVIVGITLSEEISFSESASLLPDDDEKYSESI